MTVTDNTPSPGIYESIPFETYLGWDAISNSLLSHAKRSLAHYRMARMDGAREETDAMRFGTLVHSGQLEPLALMDRYVIRPRFEDAIRKPDGGLYDNPKATAAYKAEVAAWRELHKDKIEVTAVEYENMVGVVKALAGHPIACEMLGGPGPTEVSFLWVDASTGLRCKGRCDKLDLARQMIGDLKTTGDICAFGSTIPKRGYHRQAAYYIDGILALTGVDCWFGLVAAESAKPFGVMAAPLAGDAVEAGRKEYRSLLAKIVSAQQTGEWDGPESPEEWRLPAWAMPREEGPVLDWSGVVFS